jgi:hypothetical protein
MGELCGKDYSELYYLVEAQVGDDDFAFFDLAKARATATSEVLAYEMATRSLNASQLDRIDTRMPWLRRAYKNKHREAHCACGTEADVREDHDDLVCLTCGVRKWSIRLDACKEDYGTYIHMPRRYQRSNRFRVVLNHFVEGCAASAPLEHAEAVRARLAEMGVRPEDATCVHVRRALRSLKLGKYYTISPGIAAQISGAPRLTLTSYELESMRCIFRSVEQCIQTKTRTYMPSYGMLIAAMLERTHPEAARRYVPVLSHDRTRAKVRRLCEDVMSRVFSEPSN